MTDVNIAKLAETVLDLQKQHEASMLQRRDALKAAAGDRDELKKAVARLDAIEKRLDALEKAVKKK